MDMHVHIEIHGKAYSVSATLCCVPFSVISSGTCNSALKGASKLTGVLSERYMCAHLHITRLHLDAGLPS